ncbi:hypothetical protein, partial [Escherichia coli]|uniref:hypothetical protein n=1 Tax=Escherichia coli TaxID=562 RepID=UPI003CFC2874
MPPIEIPPHVIKFVERHAVDLSKAVTPSTKEQMHAWMTGESESGKSEPAKTGKSDKKKVKSKSVKSVEKPT